MPDDVLKTVFAVVGAGEVSRAFHSIADSAGVAGKVMATFGVATGAVLGLGVAAVRTAAHFQRLEADLGTGLFRYVQHLSETSAGAVYDVDQLSKAIDRMNDLHMPLEQFRTLADTATDTGADLEGLITVFGRLQQLQRFDARSARALINMGIPAGDFQRQITAMLDRAGAASGGNMQKTLAMFLNLLDRQFGGAMDKQARTLEGKLSILGNTWTNFLTTVGNAFLPTITAAIDKLTKWFQDSKNIAAALHFAAVVAAGLEAAATVARRLVDTIQNGVKGRPRWMYEMELGFLELIRKAAGFAILIAGIKAGASIGSMFGPGGSVLGVLTGALAATGAASVVDALLKGQMADVRKAYQKDKATNGPSAGLADILSGLNIGNRAKQIEAGMSKTLGDIKAGKGSAAAPAGGVPSVGPAAQGITDRIVEQFLAGAGARGRRAASGLDAQFGLRRGGQATPIVRVVVDTTGGSIDKEVDKRVARGIQDGMNALVRRGWIVAPAH